MTAENLPSWCYAIDEILEEVAQRSGLSAEEVKRRLLASNEEGGES